MKNTSENYGALIGIVALVALLFIFGWANAQTFSYDIHETGWSYEDKIVGEWHQANAVIIIDTDKDQIIIKEETIIHTWDIILYMKTLPNLNQTQSLKLGTAQGLIVFLRQDMYGNAKIETTNSSSITFNYNMQRIL